MDATTDKHVTALLLTLSAIQALSTVYVAIELRRYCHQEKSPTANANSRAPLMQTISEHMGQQVESLPKNQTVNAASHLTREQIAELVFAQVDAADAKTTAAMKGSGQPSQQRMSLGRGKFGAGPRVGRLLWNLRLTRRQAGLR